MPSQYRPRGVLSAAVDHERVPGMHGGAGAARSLHDLLDSYPHDLPWYQALARHISRKGGVLRQWADGHSLCDQDRERAVESVQEVIRFHSLAQGRVPRRRALAALAKLIQLIRTGKIPGSYQVGCRTCGRKISKRIARLHEGIRVCQYCIALAPSSIRAKLSCSKPGGKSWNFWLAVMVREVNKRREARKAARA